MKNKLNIKQDRLAELLLLLDKDQNSLNDEQLKQLLNAKAVLFDFSNLISPNLFKDLAVILAYRRKKTEFDKFTTEELEKKLNEIMYKMYPDYLIAERREHFESYMRILGPDADEKIIREILGERSGDRQTAAQTM